MRKLAFLLSLLPGTAAVAHPHIFVGVELVVTLSEDAPPAIRVDWVYDDYFSLLITSDLGIDLDGDMVLSAEETAVLAAAVTDWPPDFKGDLEVMQDGALLALAPKTDHAMTFDAGIVRETHTRPLAAAPQGDQPLVDRKSVV